MIEETDSRLAGRAARGDREAVEELVRRHHQAVYGLALRLLGGDEHSAWDATQEAFLRALGRLSTLKGKRNFGGWVRKIAVNLCLAKFTEAQRLKPSDPNVLAQDHAVDQQGPQELNETAERKALLQEALQALGSEQQAILLLRYQEGLRYRQIARMMGMREDLARYHASQGRAALKKKLGKVLEEGHDDEV